MGLLMVVISMIWTLWAIFVFLIWVPKMDMYPVLSRVVLVLFNLTYTNLLVAFYMSVMTDPGLVPRSWGFYMGDETKRRRYCKMCNVWKPDRTHHCSICNRCILNMDHHCPWINNCVGFYNRKFFIQLLFYVYLTLVLYWLFSVLHVVFRIMDLTCGDPPEEPLHWYDFVVCFGFLITTFLICTLTNFVKFHIKLVWENYTTIENLEREDGQKSKFDIGPRRNLEQVLGANAHLWWLPFHIQNSRPVGDGVRWRVHYTRVIDEDEELPADEDQGNFNHRTFPQSSQRR